MGAVDETKGTTALTPEEEVPKLQERIRQLESENSTLSVRITELEGDETAEQTPPPPPPPPVESDELKQAKQDLALEQDKLVNDESVVSADKVAISDLEARIAALS